METGSETPGYRVLVAEDAADVATWLRILLRHAGYEVRLAATGAAALALAAEFHPQTALLDIGLPDMDGYQLAASLRALPAGDDIVLIAATGWGEADDAARSRAAGFRHHLVKPVAPDKLLALLAELRDARGD